MNRTFQKRYTLAFFIGILAGVFGAIVKWGWEVPFPPRNPNIFWPVDALERVTPPKIFLEQLGLPTDWTYMFSGMQMPLSIFIVHIGFSIIFAIAYCMSRKMASYYHVARCCFWLFCLSFCSCNRNAFNCRSSSTF